MAVSRDLGVEHADRYLLRCSPEDKDLPSRSGGSVRSPTRSGGGVGMMGKHDEGGWNADRLLQEAQLIMKQRQDTDTDPCGEWKAYADRCFDYGLQQGRNLAEAERVRVFEEGLKAGLETAVAKSDVLLPQTDPSNN